MYYKSNIIIRSECLSTTNWAYYDDFTRDLSSLKMKSELRVVVTIDWPNYFHQVRNAARRLV